MPIMNRFIYKFFFLLFAESCQKLPHNDNVNGWKDLNVTDPGACEAYLKVDRSRKRAEYELATPRELVKLRERSKACKKIEGKN